MTHVVQTSGPLMHYRRWIPRRPYATDILQEGIWLQPKWAALKRRYIQPNGVMTWCLIFDCDHDAAFFAAEDGILPPPNLMVLNQTDGRGHLNYFLKFPVPRTDFSRLRPIQYLAKIERGMLKRLDADWAFGGLITKNPLHTFWRTIERHSHLYELRELDAHLHTHNCVAPPRHEVSGLGRNCALFDDLRQQAYRKVLEFKRNGVPRSGFEAWIRTQANAVNGQFAAPLPLSETRATARSIAKWVWERFDDQTFRRLQSERGRRGNDKRWAGHVTLEKARPWEAAGISRATYFRRRKRKA